jgi:hypothetical protein
MQAFAISEAHELFKALDAEQALETLAFASLLMRRLDEAQSRRGAHDAAAQSP